MHLLPQDILVTLCVTRVTGSAEGGCAVAEKYFSSLNISQVSALWAL
jgi:hypothetical protein